MLKLQPLQPQHQKQFIPWVLDPEVTQYSQTKFVDFKTEQQAIQWYQNILKETETLNLGIFYNDFCVGYAGLTSISKINQSAEYFIFIGDKKSWGKGIATQVTKQIVEIGFNDYKLNRIMLTVSEPNIGGVKAYKNAGFEQEGVLRNACFRNGSFHNKIIMSIIK